MAKAGLQVKTIVYIQHKKRERENRKRERERERERAGYDKNAYTVDTTGENEAKAAQVARALRNGKVI